MTNDPVKDRLLDELVKLAEDLMPWGEIGAWQEAANGGELRRRLREYGQRASAILSDAAFV